MNVTQYTNITAVKYVKKRLQLHRQNIKYILKWVLD